MREEGPARRRGPWWWELQGGIVGGNAGGRIFLDGAVELGNPYSADFPRPDLRLGSALLAAAGAILVNLAGAKEAGNVDVRPLAKAGREFRDLTETSDAMPFGLGLPLALGVFPRALGGERKHG